MDIWNWKLWLIASLIILFLLWFFSDGQARFEGLAELQMPTLPDGSRPPVRRAQERLRPPARRENRPQSVPAITRHNTPTDDLSGPEPELTTTRGDLTRPAVEQQPVVRQEPEVAQPSELPLACPLWVKNLRPSQRSAESAGQRGFAKKSTKGETFCRYILETLLKQPFPGTRPDFLRNPETNRSLELDCYNEELNLALEYNGYQHYHFPNQYHRVGNEQAFIQQRRRDRFKREVCFRRGINLIEVPYNIAEHQLAEYIWARLPKDLQLWVLSQV